MSNKAVVNPFTKTLQLLRNNLADLGIKIHDSLTDVTADQHHNESHTIASHSDTTGTGAELNTLTDGSETALHSHALTNKTSFASIGPSDFTTSSPDVDDVTQSGGNFFRANEAVTVHGSIQLPHGAVITGAIMYGNTSAETWALRRDNKDTTFTTIASGNFNSQDTSIATPTVDNQNHYYTFLATLDNGETITAAIVQYTTDYD